MFNEYSERYDHTKVCPSGMQRIKSQVTLFRVQNRSTTLKPEQIEELRKIAREDRDTHDRLQITRELVSEFLKRSGS